jgi:hypothetical protein
MESRMWMVLCVLDYIFKLNYSWTVFILDLLGKFPSLIQLKIHWCYFRNCQFGIHGILNNVMIMHHFTLFVWIPRCLNKKCTPDVTLNFIVTHVHVCCRNKPQLFWLHQKRKLKMLAFSWRMREKRKKKRKKKKSHRRNQKYWVVVNELLCWNPSYG